MSRRKKIRILLPIVIVVFWAAYAEHKIVQREAVNVGRMQNKVMDEISGIAASGIHNNILYVHNDSGDSSRFFAITPQGDLRAVIRFPGDPKEKLGILDAEDIAVGPGPVKGKSYVYIGDIGDNYNKRENITIYRIEEQASWLKDSLVNAKSTALILKYPDGPRDAETLMLDPVEKLLYIVSKRKDSVGIYTTPLNFKNNDTLTMTLRCKIHTDGFPPFKWITAGDISKDGKQVLLKSYADVYYWKRENNESAWQAMKAKPQKLFYKQEKQGEAIGFSADGKGFYTTSEGVFAPIYYYNSP
jgi:hypothetical protein